MDETISFTTGLAKPTDKRKGGPVRNGGIREAPVGSHRDFLDNRFVFTVVSARAGGLAIGINMCPDKNCNFHCIYCDVHRNGDPIEHLDVAVMAAELKRTLAFVHGGRLRERPWYHNLPDDLLQLRHVALSGDGEPTLSPLFADALQEIVHVRALCGFPFRLVLLTNATGLDLPHVQHGLKYFTKGDDFWLKLDGGTQAYVNRVNRSALPLEKVLSNILLLARLRPIVIQSMFPAINGEEPPLEEIEAYAQRLLELRDAGANISLVQIYSSNRPSPNSESGHLPLKVLSRIAHTVRSISGLNTEVF